MLANNPYLNKSPSYLDKNKKALKFNGYVTRPDISKSNNIHINDSRFEVINKDPEILTRSKRIPNVNFKNATARGELYKPQGRGDDFYTPQKENTMGRLNKGIASFRRTEAREPKKGLGMTTPFSSSYDYTAAIVAKTKILRPRVVSLSNLGKQSPRDDIMMRQTDAFRNIELDNTKEIRVADMKARKKNRSSIPSSHIFSR